MTISEIRILPPFAIGRLGSAPDPQDNYTLADDPASPLGFRKIQGAPTLVVDRGTGEITHTHIPETVLFRSGESIRPVAPFLEVFAVIPHADGTETIEPLTQTLVESLGPAKVEWRVSVANRKVARRTGNADDVVMADTGWFFGHEIQTLQGHSKNFVSTDAFIDFGNVRFLRPNARYPEIRLRFTPAKGLIYGPAGRTDDKVIPADRAIYDGTKGSWAGFGKDPVENETLPPSLYAIEAPAPSWLNDNTAISRGYLDDACDGFVQVRLTLSEGRTFAATARICAGPPAVVPDSLFVRNLADDLEQVIDGMNVSRDEPAEVTRERAAAIVRRAFETVRFLNIALMNGNNYQGRAALSLDSMPEEEAADTERSIRPVMSPGTVDTFAILALHEQIYTALRGGAAAWFVPLLRRPDEVADFTDHGRRKMPALMCGADNNYLALTWRQIDTIRKAAEEGIFASVDGAKSPAKPLLTPLNRTAQLHYEAAGNPESSRPVTAVANCCPGLEVDFRAVWRRLFKGVVLREYDNLVVDVDEDAQPEIQCLKGQRLLRIRLPGIAKPILTMTPITGPATSDPDGAIALTTQSNPNGLACLEWSNALAPVLGAFQGKTVTCDFTDMSIEEAAVQQPCTENPKNYISLDIEVRHFFEADTAVISRELAEAGELTQGLCSPWQNDYRECSCYYWASARPDYVNVEPASNGLSKGDNWLQKERTGRYVPDDYSDTRLVLYDDLFEAWERWLRIQIGGRDATDTGVQGQSEKLIARAEGAS